MISDVILQHIYFHLFFQGWEENVPFGPKYFFDQSEL